MADPTDPESSQALLRRATAWLQDHLLNHAEITLRRVLAAEPANRQSQRLPRIALFQLPLRGGLAPHPRNRRAQGRPGTALFRLGGRDEGLAALQAAGGADPGTPRAWADLAVALRDAGRGDAAEAAYAKALAAQSPGA